jgi:release factor glutamine methyltransferase
MQKFNQWLAEATKKLESNNIPSANLDAELILSKTLECTRTFLHANNDNTIDSDKLKTANNLLERRANREPIAYITGHKEFYGHDYLVTKDTLIPRPESEQIIEFIKKLQFNQIIQPRLVDIGTGSGCLGITSKLERPELDVTLIDISPQALEIAKNNATNLNAEVLIQQNDLLNNIETPYDVIVANLPYVDKTWQRSPETNYEPSVALFAEDGGMQLIKKLIPQCATKLNQNGYLIIEADPVQHIELIDFASDYNLNLTDCKDYILLFIHQY